MEPESSVVSAVIQSMRDKGMKVCAFCRSCHIIIHVTISVIAIKSDHLESYCVILFSQCCLISRGAHYQSFLSTPFHQ